MKKLIVLFAAIVLTSSTISLAGGPWTQPKGKAYIKLSEWWIVFDQHYTDVGKIDPNVTTGIFNTNLYGEYGITDKLDAIVNATIFSRNYMNNLKSKTTNEILVEGEDLNAIGDIDVGIKYGLSKTHSKIPVAASVYFGIPSGKTSEGTLKNLQTGDGEFNQIIQLDAGKSFSVHEKISSYGSATIAFNNRTNNFSDEFRYGIEIGMGLMRQKLWVIGRMTGISSLENGSTAETTTSASIFANNTEYTSIGLELSYYISNKIGVSTSFAGASSGKIIAAAPSYSFGVFFDMNK